MSEPAVLEASLGDYRYLLQKGCDGNFTCTRIAIDDRTPNAPWAEKVAPQHIPEVLRIQFLIATQAQSPAVGLQGRR